jgi:hypothetical protein
MSDRGAKDEEDCEETVQGHPEVSAIFQFTGSDSFQFGDAFVAKQKQSTSCVAPVRASFLARGLYALTNVSEVVALLDNPSRVQHQFTLHQGGVKLKRYWWKWEP